ncbi:hypothetical protein Vau01_105060 [Virgisporangium aurantiacum]|uniref:Uncharacterized protein n=1 Tax=Virgisporangium aurantiacum TaxID=175570 RepID=A0A8J3ZK71_9ACTN|nr:hypothetical protein Vau01_105060 [Virgisporangium aurantiacum]
MVRQRGRAWRWAGATAAVAGLVAVGAAVQTPAAIAAEHGKEWKFQRVDVPGVTLPFDPAKVGDETRVVTGQGAGPFTKAYPRGINIGKKGDTDGTPNGPETGTVGVDPAKHSIGRSGNPAADKWTGSDEIRDPDNDWFTFRSRAFTQGSLVGNGSAVNIVAIEFSSQNKGDTFVTPPAADGLTFTVEKGGPCGSKLVVTFAKPLKPGEFIWMSLPKFDEKSGMIGAFIPAKAQKKNNNKNEPAERLAPTSVPDPEPTVPPTGSATVSPTVSGPPGPEPQPTWTQAPDPTSTTPVDPSASDSCVLVVSDDEILI